MQYHETLRKTSPNNKQSYLVNPEVITQSLISVLRKEVDALIGVTLHFPENAWRLVDSILKITGKVIFSGIGKSGLVARKIAATFSSLGVPAVFLHPTDALHGDLGIVQANDYVIILSKSGTGQELELLLPVLKSLHISTALICCSPGVLSKKVTLSVVLPFDREACELNLAPTSSSTITIAFGDALAIVISKMKGFSKKEFASNHPAGALGKKLLLKVGSFIHDGQELPFLSRETSFQDLLVTITSKKLGIGIVIDEDKKILGVITDGDLRRACKRGPAVFSEAAGNIMTPSPKVITQDELGYRALEIMENFNITSLIVIDDQQRVAGLVHIHDLIKAGLRS